MNWKGKDWKRDLDVLARRVTRRLPNIWSVGLVLPGTGGVPSFSQPLLQPGRDPISHLSLAADPFFISSRDQVFLYFEGIERGSSLGQIFLAVLNPDGKIHLEGPIISPGVHCSFPFVFRDSQTLTYGMIPETSEAGEVRLYTSSAPGGPWKLKETLVSGHPFSDTVMVNCRGQRILVSEISGGSNDQRAIVSMDESGRFSSVEVFKLGPGRSRMAGRIVDIRDDVNTNPISLLTQDCSTTYGHSIRVEQLDWDGGPIDESMFKEPLTLLEPNLCRWFRAKTHSADLRLTEQGVVGVFDGKGPPVLAAELCQKSTVAEFVELACTSSADGIPTRG